MPVFLVQSVLDVEDDHLVFSVEKLFVNRELAEKWIERKVAREKKLREAQARASEISEEWYRENLFVFDEKKPPAPKKWPSGMRKEDITPEMRTEREAQKKLEQEFCARYGAARTAYREQLEKHLSAVLAAEGLPEIDLWAGFSSNDPAEYNITEMEVCETDDLEEGDL